MDGLRIWYDRAGDVLEVRFEDTPAEMEEIRDDVFERWTPDGRVVGFVVMCVSQHDRESLHLPLHVTARSTR